MKNRMIRQAWDTVSPTAEQKARMRAMLEARMETASSNKSSEPEEFATLDFTLPYQNPYASEQKKKSQKENAQPRYQARYSETRRSGWGAGIAAVAVLLLMVSIGGLYLGMLRGSRSEDPQFVSPTVTEVVPAVTETEEMPTAYQSLIGQYLTAIQERWTMNQCDQANLSQSLPEIKDAEDLGYSLRDLDHNGIDELIITDGLEIYALYTLDGGSAKRLISSPEYETYTMAESGSIQVVSSGSSTVYYYYSYLLENGALKLDWNLCYDWEVYPDSPWHMLDNETGEVKLHLSQEDALTSLYTFPVAIYISHIPLTGEIIEEKLPDEASFPVYAQALLDWEESYNGSAPTTYCFHDFDGDGEQELIIGEGNKFLFAVKNVDGTAQTSVIRNGRSNLYLCEDGVLLTYFDGGDVDYYTYSKMESLDQGKSVDYLVHDIYANTWTWKEHESMGLVTEKSEAEAQAIIDSHPLAKLKWRSITEFPGIDQVSAQIEEDQLLALYAQAIPEALKDYSKAEDQTFCFWDVDGDGKAELLLGAGNSVYRILQPRTGSESFIDISAPTGNESDAYLCKGNVLEIRGYAHGNNHYQYIKIGDADGTMESEQMDYIFYSPETECWYEGGSGINTPISDEKADAIMDTYPRVSLDWLHISDFPVAIAGNVQSGTALFERIFMGMAQGEIGSSTEEFLEALQYYGFAWKQTEGFIEVQEPENNGSYLSAELTNRSGTEEVYILDYVVTEGGQQRIASIQITDEGTYLTIAANPISAGKSVDAPEDLRAFILGRDEQQLLDVLAREFAYAYFHQDWNYLRENLAPDFGDAYVYTDGDAALLQINAVMGTDQIVKGGALLSAECRISPDSDSVVYLTMEFTNRDGYWKVASYGLEG